MLSESCLLHGIGTPFCITAFEKKITITHCWHKFNGIHNHGNDKGKGKAKPKSGDDNEMNGVILGNNLWADVKEK